MHGRVRLEAANRSKKGKKRRAAWLIRLANGICAVYGWSLMENTDGVLRIATNMQLQVSRNGLPGSDLKERPALNRTKEKFS